MIDNTKVFNCACRVMGLMHSFTTDCSTRYILMVDPRNAHLLRDACWSVSPIHRKSRLLRARATTSAPGIKVGQSLHQLAARIRNPKKRRMHAINRSCLDARRANLRTVTRSDTRILYRTAPNTKALGVRRNKQPRFMKTWFCPWSAHIGVDGKSLYLGAFATLEDAQSAWDAAATMLHGPNATTNQTLGLMSPEVAKTKPCRKAAEAARSVIKGYRSGELAKKSRARVKAKSRRKALQIFSDIRAIGKPVRGLWVEVAQFGAAGASQSGALAT